MSKEMKSIYFLFTLHFATINTLFFSILICNLSPFTLHFATINTKTSIYRSEIVNVFTLHFATINT